jgi:hypothetical protein
MVGDVMNTMRAILRAKSSLGDPFEGVSEWQTANVISLATLTALGLLGVPMIQDFGYQKIAARKSLQTVIQDFGPITGVVAEFASSLEFTPAQRVSFLSWSGLIDNSPGRFRNPDIVCSPSGLFLIRKLSIRRMIGTRQGMSSM